MDPSKKQFDTMRNCPGVRYKIKAKLAADLVLLKHPHMYLYENVCPVISHYLSSLVLFIPKYQNFKRTDKKD